MTNQENEKIVTRYIQNKPFSVPIEHNFHRFDDYYNINIRNKHLFANNISLYSTILNHRSFPYFFIKNIKILSNLDISLVDHYDINNFFSHDMLDKFISNIPINPEIEDPIYINDNKFTYSNILCLYSLEQKLCYVDRLRLIPINSSIEYYNISNHAIFYFPNKIISSSLNFSNIRNNKINTNVYNTYNNNRTIINNIDILDLNKNDFIIYYNGLVENNIEQRLFEYLNLTIFNDIEIKIYNSLYDAKNLINFNYLEFTNINRNIIKKVYRNKLLKSKNDYDKNVLKLEYFKIKIYKTTNASYKLL